MNNILHPLSRKYFNLICLFTRDPFMKFTTNELEYYTDNGELIACICLDKIDNNYSAVVLSRDKAMQYRAENVMVDLEKIQDARDWIQSIFNSNRITLHTNDREYFDIFEKGVCKNNIHPHYNLLRDNIAYLSAKEAIKEISYHYTDIDGNFIEQFQSLNGFDSRVFELYLYCFFREQGFYFKREHHFPDYMVNKLGKDIAVEAVIISRKSKDLNSINNFDFETIKTVQSNLSNEVPLMFASAIFDKSKKKYWEKEHVKGIPFVLAIADFHETMSMIMTFNSLLDYLYGYNYSHTTHSNTGELIIKPEKIEDYVKSNGTKIPAGFFLDKNNENISAIIFSATATLSKFNRMGKQAGLGSNTSNLIRMMIKYNHDKNADVPDFVTYTVDENSDETWSEGVVIYHNPNALIPLDIDLFDDTVAHCFFDGESKLIKSLMPKIFPYCSITNNQIIKK